MNDQNPPVPDRAADGAPPPFSQASAMPPAAPAYQPPSAYQPPPAPGYRPPPAPAYQSPAAAYQPPTAPAYQPPPAAGYGAVQPYQHPPGTAPAYPAYAAPGYAPPRPSSGLAVASMICGIVGFLASPFMTMLLPVLIPLAAVILGHRALRQLRSRPELGGKGMAIAGLILGYIPLAISALLLLLMIFAVGVLGAFTVPFLGS